MKIDRVDNEREKSYWVDTLLEKNPNNKKAIRIKTEIEKNNKELILNSQGQSKQNLKSAQDFFNRGISNLRLGLNPIDNEKLRLASNDFKQAWELEPKNSIYQNVFESSKAYINKISKILKSSIIFNGLNQSYQFKSILTDKGLLQFKNAKGDDRSNNIILPQNNF